MDYDCAKKIMSVRVLILTLAVLYIRLGVNRKILLLSVLLIGFSFYSLSLQANTLKSTKVIDNIKISMPVNFPKKVIHEQNKANKENFNQIYLEISSWEVLRELTLYLMLFTTSCGLLLLICKHYVKLKKYSIEHQNNATTCDVLLKNNNMEHMIKETKQLIEDICHQTRNPQQFIQANLNSLELKEVSITDYIQKQQKEVNELTSLTDKILDIVLINVCDKSTFKLENISGKLKGMLIGFSGVAKMKGLTLDWQIEDHLTLKCSLICIERLVENILSNSIRFTKKGNIHFEAYLENKQLVIVCADTGIGIPDKDKNAIFNWSSKGSNTTKSQNKSLGIGLSIAQEVVKAHQGNLYLISDVNKGTTISINLPAYDVSKKEPFQNIKTEHIDLQKTSEFLEEKDVILIVESNLDLLTYLKNLLGNYYHIIIALDADSGLIQARKSLPDMIVIDVPFESNDDFEFIRCIRSCDKINHIPVILITGKKDKTSKVEGFSAGANDYITKPFQEADILNRIKNQLALIKSAKKRALAPMDKQPSEDRVIALFLSYICKNYDKSEIQITDLSKALFISNKQLERKVKHYLGKTPNQYLNIYRLARAKDLLTSGQQPKNVYTECGFSSHTYFSKKFKEHYGHSPSFFIEK